MVLPLSVKQIHSAEDKVQQNDIKHTREDHNLLAKEIPLIPWQGLYLIKHLAQSKGKADEKAVQRPQPPDLELLIYNEA